MAKRSSTNESQSNIIIIDDQTQNLKILAEILQSAGYRVRPSNDPRLALKSAIMEAPDLIMLDIKMPDMDGFEVCRRLKEAPETKEIPVLFVSGLNDIEDQLKGFEVGGVDYISKPVRREEVLARVHTHLSISRHARELYQAQLELKLANRSKSQFLSNMRHEFYTPLNTIIGMSHILKETITNNNQLKTLDKIENSAHRLLSIIREMFDFIQIESGKIKIDNFDFDLRKTMNKAFKILSDRARNKELKINVKVDSEIPTLLNGDSERLLQILTILIDNAVKFTGDGGRINIDSHVYKLSKERVTIEFIVRDTGVGIQPELISKLFKPFTQADGSMTRQYEGVGLGLIIAKQLSDLMNGHIRVESKLGEGTAFYVLLDFEVTSNLTSGQQLSRQLHPLPDDVESVLSSNESVNSTIPTDTAYLSTLSQKQRSQAVLQLHMIKATIQENNYSALDSLESVKQTLLQSGFKEMTLRNLEQAVNDFDFERASYEIDRLAGELNNKL